MEKFFNFIYAKTNFFGKARVLKKIIKLYKMDQSKTFYIGDETGDIEAAKACRVNSIAVTWGFNSEKILSTFKPHYLAKKPEDLLTIFEEIKK